MPIGSERILLIDDEVMVIDIVKRMLMETGYQVTYFLDAEEALVYFSEHSPDVDLVIMS